MDTPEYIQVIVPVKLDWEPTYLTYDPDVKVGTRVRISLAGRKHTAVVSATGIKPNIDTGRIKPIDSIEAALDPISESEIKFWRFLSGYYMCSIGEIFKAAYPTLRVDSEKKKPRKKAKNEQVLMEGSINTEILKDKTLLRCPERNSEAEILISNIKEAIQSGKGHVLFLVPDKIRCAELENRLRTQFEDILLVYNSETTYAQRRDIAKLARGKEHRIFLGTRSSIFLPFSELSLVVIFDEHDPSYKQNSPAPRYNGRDAACMLATFFKSKLILSSPTPSLESRHNCLNGKYSFTDLPGKKASLTVIDTTAEKRKSGMDGDMAKKTIHIIEEAGNKGKDVKVITPGEINKAKIGKEDLVVLTFGDVILKRDDFRADERMLQVLDNLRYRCSDLVIQTSQGDHPVFKMNDSIELLNERKEFGLPPFTRQVEISISDNNEARKGLMTKELTRALGGSLRFNLLSDNSLKSIKEDIFKRIREFETKRKYHSHIVIDVDPLA